MSSPIHSVLALASTLMSAILPARAGTRLSQINAHSGTGPRRLCQHCYIPKTCHSCLTEDPCQQEAEMRLSQDCIAGFVILPSASKSHVRRRQLPPSEFSEGSSLILAESSSLRREQCPCFGHARRRWLCKVPMIYMQDARSDRARDNERLRTDVGLWATCRTCMICHE